MRIAYYKRPDGELKTSEIICFENKSIYIVNGRVVMILRNPGYIKDGVSIPMNKRKILIESEAIEVFYNDIKIRNMKSPTAA